MLTCFDIGGTSIKAVRASDPQNLTLLGRKPTPRDDFAAFVAVLEGFLDQRDEAPIAISVTGVVEPDSGRVTVANIPCIDGRNLAGDLQEALDRKVLVANDADCFVLAEAHAGAGRGHGVVFGAILGTGVGGGIVAHGRLFRGAGGLAGEWGHGGILATRLSVPPYEMPQFPCGCGKRGCVDTVGGARGLETLHRHIHGAALESTAIIAAWTAGDAAAGVTLAAYLELVAQPLALAVNIVGPDIIPVGGGLGNSVELVAALDRQVRQRILRTLDRPLVVPAQLSVDAGLIGAASLGFSEGLA